MNRCRFCNKPTDDFLCSSCLRCEEKRVRFQNSRKLSKHILSIDEWLDILGQNNFACKACKTETELLTLDHIVALSKGGLNIKMNVQPLCSYCHNIKAMVETKLTGNKKKRLEAKELMQEFNYIFGV